MSSAVEVKRGDFMNKILTGLFMAWGNFSVVPSPRKVWDDKCRNWMIAMMPVIGLLIGALQFAVYSIFQMMYERGVVGNHIVFQAAILTFLPFYLTGFIHLDGFMDTCDSLLSRREQSEMQRILKDSRVGAFAVICFVFTVVLYFGSLTAIQTGIYSWEKMFALATIPFFARFISVLCVLKMKPIEQSQYNEMETGKDRDNSVFAAIAVGALITFVCVFFSVYLFRRYAELVMAGVGAIVASYLAIKNASNKIGGINGDIAGYGIVMGELVGVVILGICA